MFFSAVKEKYVHTSMAYCVTVNMCAPNNANSVFFTSCKHQSKCVPKRVAAYEKKINWLNEGRIEVSAKIFGRK